jgi:hypothetical protein
LAACDPTSKLGLCGELSLIKQTTKQGISAGRSGSNDTLWQSWAEFCLSLHQDAWLQDIVNPLPLLQIFANRYRVGALVPSGSPVKARTVEATTLCAVGQMFPSLGQPNPCLQPSGRLDLQLQCQLQQYKKADPLPTRVKPASLQVIQLAITQCQWSTLPTVQEISHMFILGFFSLLRPGEYAHTNNPEAAPFRICNAHLITNNQRLDLLTCSNVDLTVTAYVGLEFTTQKNGVRGELVGLGRSGHHIFCPVITMIEQIQHLHLHGA